MKIEIKRNGNIVAVMTLDRMDGNEFEIAYVWVSPAYRGRKLASQLMKRAMEKCDSLVSFIDPDGTGLTYEQIKQWHLRYGFKFCWYDFYGDGSRKKALIWEKNK